MKESYRSSVITGTPKADIDSYFNRPKPHIKALIEDQLKKIQSTKVIMALWVRWKNPVSLAITLGHEDVQGAQDIRGNTGDNYISEEISFNSLIEFF